MEGELKALEGVRALCLGLVELQRNLTDAEATLRQLNAKRPQVKARKSHAEAQASDARKSTYQCAGEVARHSRTRPGLFSRLFRTVRWQEWSRANAPLVQAASRASAALQAADLAVAEVTAALAALAAQVKDASGRTTALRKKVSELSREIDGHRRTLGDRIVDDAFFARGHNASNLTAPWIPDSLHRKREDLFIAALAVHRAFIDASAQKMLHNLNVLMGVLSGGPPGAEEKRKLLGDLWSTLFMVVPVLSTTFASVDRMLGYLPPGSIGWLLIDEAGQALPQAAVGAIMRARRSIVVGDPLQIPPVVTLPERLNTEICRYFKVDESAWSAPQASAQALADRTSRFQAAFRSERSPRRVGIPLLVHRRCQEPMFGISNRIAYDEQMVHAPGPRNPGAIGAALGPCAWFDIDGDADSVILVLGAPNASQNGARSWAAGAPNILNVAVSRAKQNLYVVGSYGAWSGVGHAREVATLPRRRC